MLNQICTNAFPFFCFSPAQTHTHIRLMALCPGLPGWAGTRKVKPIWILLKQETVSGSGICWAICKSAPCSRQIIIVQFFTGRVPFLPPNQQHQSTEGRSAQPLKMPIKNLQPKSLCSAFFSLILVKMHYHTHTQYHHHLATSCWLRSISGIMRSR